MFCVIENFGFVQYLKSIQSIFLNSIRMNHYSAKHWMTRSPVHFCLFHLFVTKRANFFVSCKPTPDRQKGETSERRVTCRDNGPTPMGWHASGHLFIWTPPASNTLWLLHRLLNHKEEGIQCCFFCFSHLFLILCRRIIGNVISSDDALVLTFFT